MDVKERAEKATAHIKDPVERERRRKSMERALRAVETEESEKIAEDDGRLDGIPVRKLADLQASEDARLAPLKAQRSSIFEVEDEPVLSPEDALNQKGRYGYTRLIQAVVEEDLQSARQLLELGADFTITENGGMTALDKAKGSGNAKMIALLHEFGA